MSDIVTNDSSSSPLPDSQPQTSNVSTVVNTTVTPAPNSASKGVRAVTSWKVWLHSLASAAIGGAASALGSYYIAPSLFNFSKAGLLRLGGVALFGAFTPVIALLKKSPIPDYVPE